VRGVLELTVAKVRVKGVRLARNGVGEQAYDDVVVDLPVNIYINGKYFATIFATPSDLEEMALGMVLSEGMSEGPGEIRSIKVRDTSVFVELSRDINPSKYSPLARYASCSPLSDYLASIDARPATSSYKVTVEQVYGMIRELSRFSIGHRGSLAVHVAAIFEDCRMRCVASDVNRHVTVDKAIGKAVRAGIDFSRSVLVTTGRQAADTIAKAARMGIPITVSLRGPLYSGIYLASKLGITVVALTRGRGLVAYTHPERIVT